MILGKYVRIVLLFYCGSMLIFPIQGAYAGSYEIDSLLTELKNRSGTSRADILIDLSYKYLQEDTIKADYYLRKARQQSKSLNYLKGIGWCNYLQGMRYFQQNRPSDIINIEAQAVSIGRSVNDYDLIARAYNAMGLANFLLDDHYNALKLFSSALRALEKAKDKSFEGAYIGNIGIAHIKNKRYKEGLVYMKRASLMHIKTGNKVWLSDNYLETGLAYDKMKNYDQALYYGLKALKLVKEVKRPRIEILTKILLGSVYIKLNNLVTGKRYLDEVFPKISTRSMQPERLQLYESYARLFEKRKDYHQAFLYQKRYSQLYDTVFNAGRAKIILEYQEKFQSQQKNWKTNSFVKISLVKIFRSSKRTKHLIISI